MTLSAYDELCGYTLAHGDPSFIHQYVVDAQTAQAATAQTKPIALAFALAGLYLHVEKQHTGRQVQRVHMLLARGTRQWPAFSLPADRGDITAAQIIAEPPGPRRDRAIDAWCASVWNAFHDSRDAVIEWLRGHDIG